MHKFLVHFGFLLLSLATLPSCNGPERLVVYADPWCGDYAAAAVGEFEKMEAEFEVELRVLSSEVIVQHLHFGQDIEVAILLDSTLLGRKSLWSKVKAERGLAEATLVLAERKGKLNIGIPGAGGRVVEATGRPVRTWADKWKGEQEEGILVGNFYKQTRDYLLRAWGREGMVLASLVRCHPNELVVKEKGPEIPGGFRAYQFAPKEEGAAPDVFMDFLGSEKSIELLGAFHLIP